jgi:hypothetical protein
VPISATAVCRLAYFSLRLPAPRLSPLDPWDPSGAAPDRTLWTTPGESFGVVPEAALSQGTRCFRVIAITGVHHAQPLDHVRLDSAPIAHAYRVASHAAIGTT